MSKIPEIGHCLGSKASNLGGKSSLESIKVNSMVSIKVTILVSINVGINVSIMVSKVSKILTKNSFKSENGLVISPLLRDFYFLCLTASRCLDCPLGAKGKSN